MATNQPQDDFQKTALRLPKDLHAQLHEAAAASGRSYNSEIVQRLQASFERSGNFTASVIESTQTGDTASTTSEVQALRAELEIERRSAQLARLQVWAEGADRRVEGTILYVLLDSNGYPLSWAEIHEYLVAMKSAGNLNVTDMQVQVLTPDMESSSRRAMEVAALAKMLRNTGRSQVFGEESVVPKKVCVSLPAVPTSADESLPAPASATPEKASKKRRPTVRLRPPPSLEPKDKP